MAGINPILGNTVMKPLRYLSEAGFVKNAGKKVNENNRKYIDGLGVASIVAKDGLGCYLYVTQSMNNKDIPDDKRKFVAALDLTNGLLMIGFQILMFFTVSHKVCQTKMFDKFFGKLFDRPIKKLYQTAIQNSPDIKNVNNIKYTKEFEKIRANVKDAFGGLTSLAAATIIGKRMLVPFIATPLAGKVEKKMNEKEAQKKGLPSPAEKKEDNSNPTMKGVSHLEQNEATQAQQIPSINGNTNLLSQYKEKNKI